MKFSLNLFMSCETINHKAGLSEKLLNVICVNLGSTISSILSIPLLFHSVPSFIKVEAWAKYKADWHEHIIWWLRQLWNMLAQVMQAHDWEMRSWPVWILVCVESSKVTGLDSLFARLHKDSLMSIVLFTLKKTASHVGGLLCSYTPSKLIW